jgi:dipeptidyl aminopeptidase/acylaminoacyl peptidase
MYRLFALVLLLVPTVVAAEPAALIPREVLLGNPERTTLRLSPDGTLLSFLAPSPDGVMNVWVQDIASGDERMVTSNTHRGIWGYEWAFDSERLLFVQDRDGDENWHLYVADVTNGESRDLTPFEGTAAQNLMTSRAAPHHVLVALNKDDRTRFDMYRIDIRTGELTLEAENPGDIQNWLADEQLRVRAACALDPETSDTIIRTRATTEDPWREIVRWSFEETGSVLYKKLLGFSPDGTRLYVQSPKGTNTTHLALMDAVTGEEIEILAHDERSDLANFWWEPVVLFSPDRSRVQAVMFDYLVAEWHVLDESVRADFETLEAMDRGVFWIEDRDSGDLKWIVTFESDVRPARTYIYDRTSKTAELVFDSNPAVADYELAPMKPITITARDGLEIPGYLTLPVGVAAEGLPMVMHPHGGPWARDYWYFSPVVQMLANRGYAVLQVNFRGSTGYGRDHLNAGNGQWGVGAMQHDITDAVKWAVDEGIADPDRIGIYGGSYGGYATLAGAAFTPELYACAVSVVGPSNVSTLFASFPPTWAVRKLRWKLRVGPVEEDPSYNQRISPLFHVDKIEAPLLIGHGANDPRVKLHESEQIVEALTVRDMSVGFVVYPDEGHGFNRPENNLDWEGRVETFLAEHLGGRSEPFETIKGTSADVRR